MDYDKLELANIQKDQEFRVIPNQNKRYTDILIPFDKIGHTEEVSLVHEVDMTNYLGTKGTMPSFLYKLKISVVTNGFTKFLEITDVADQTKEQMQDMDASNNTFNVINSADSQIEAKMKMVDLSIQNIVLSVIHKRSELMTIFVNKLNMHITETERLKQIKFSIGYLQIDNQSEQDPVYPVMLSPRDLYYNPENDTISLRVAELIEQDKNDKLKHHLHSVSSDDAKMFQFQMVINNETSEMNDKKDILYIEHIAFLLQTLNIKVQFSHFLKLTNLM